MKNEKKEPKSIGLQVGLVSLADPTHIFYNIFNYNNIILYYNIIYLKKNLKKSQRTFQNIFDFLVCFSTNFI
jgi:hypothetical protein